MTHPAFNLIRRQQISTLNVELQEYQHLKTGARHFHLQANDNNNVFLVAFLTVPEDSTGVAHILEHTTLCGSQRFPVRDPFFMMTRRSLNTFMNAMTSSDWTAYPFASQNKKDFYNLLEVYLDAVFFPHLSPLDFAQEGWRLEFEKPDDSSSPLVYKGIVYNEMKGALSSPNQSIWEELSQLLYPTITYHFNSGGEPKEIPNLTYEQLKSFHAAHYHPSNAIFMTYGDIPAEEHQNYFEEKALKQFEKLELDLSIPDEQRYQAPIKKEGFYAVEENEELDNKCYVLIAWLLGKNTDARDWLNAHLLSGMLLDDSASPLRQALEITELGTAPSGLSGLESSTREMNFCAGLEGCNAENADAVEALIFEVLQQVANEGVPQERLESVLHQMELHQREITGDHVPYGLRLLLNSLTPAIHGGDPLSMLDIDPALEALRKDVQNPDFIKNLVKTQLLDNPHRVRLVMKPDPELNAKRIAEETQRLADLKAQLNSEEISKIIEQTQQLADRQNTQDNPELLPKVTLKDVADDLLIVDGKASEIKKIPTTWFAQGTNGMVYQEVVLDLPDLSEELIDLIPIFCDAITEVGVGNRDYLATQSWQSAVSGGIRAGVTVRGGVHDVQQTRNLFMLSGKSLARHHADLTQLIHDTFTKVRFDETSRLRDLVAQARLEVENSIPSRGIALVNNTAVSRLNPSSALAYRWSGFGGIRYLKKLDDALNDESQLLELSQKLTELRDILINTPRQLLIISEAERQADIAQALENYWDFEPQKTNLLKLPSISGQTREAWGVNTQVNFTAKAYQTVPYAHPDAPILSVLGDFLRNGYLHRTIREQGGAYGGNASYDSDNGAFRFFSYRDPRLVETLADYDRSLTWLQETSHESRVLEEAILGIIARIDRPSSPAGEAKTAFFGNLHGRTPELRRSFRSKILNVKIEDLQRVAAQYLRPELANIAVVSNPKLLEEHADKLGLKLETL
jgi:Zn-dependent M16 (insulinase) family peptidase